MISVGGRVRFDHTVYCRISTQNVATAPAGRFGPLAHHTHRHVFAYRLCFHDMASASVIGISSMTCVGVAI